jgi:RHH-type rel operon transcriptional repressor/antitoxin RelB
MVVSVRLSGDLEERLDALSERTGRPKSFYVKSALEAHLADLEDQYWADQVIARFEAGDQTTRPISDLITELGL